MPIENTLVQSAKGHKVVRSYSSGDISIDDAKALAKQLEQGGSLHGIPLLSVVNSNANYTPESRQIFANLKNIHVPCAVVVTSAPLRVMLNFIIKAGNLKAAALGDATTRAEFFKTEPEAIAWIDAQVN